jgi:hypothetical protein
VAIALLGGVLFPLAAAVATADDASTYSAIVERPLFDPSRHAHTPPPSAAVQAPAPVAPVASGQASLRAVLVGVVAGGDRPMALLRGADGRVLQLTVGEAIDGWRIVDIALRSVDVERDGVRQTLKLPAPASL